MEEGENPFNSILLMSKLRLTGITCLISHYKNLFTTSLMKPGGVCLGKVPYLIQMQEKRRCGHRQSQTGRSTSIETGPFKLGVSGTQKRS